MIPKKECATAVKLTALVENIAHPPLCAVHGLSLYIETQQHKILFDVGTKGAIFPNAEILGIDLTAIDIAFISHGHNDHGDDLSAFLAINHTAQVYIQRAAFEGHFSLPAGTSQRKPIGLDVSLLHHPQIILVDGDLVIDQELQLFRADTTARLHSTANDTLYDEEGQDRFLHEQNLIIHEGDKTALIMGCGHSGIANILDKAAQWAPTLCVGGFHLYNPTAKTTVADSLLDAISQEMAQYPIHYYTCHCTGEYAFRYLQSRLPKMDYLSAGTQVSL